MPWKTSAERASSSESRNAGGILFVGLVATFIVVEAIYGNWHAYNSSKKLEALCLLALLVIGPARIILDERKNPGSIGRADIAMWGYACIMMITFLFGS